MTKPTDLGVTIDSHRFTLRTGPPDTTEKPLKLHRRVWGTFSGVITDCRASTKRKDGSTEVVWVIEVDETIIERMQEES